MCNLHWCYTFCTDVTLFALVLHLNCTALSQSESSNFFMCIIKQVNFFLRHSDLQSLTIILFVLNTPALNIVTVLNTIIDYQLHILYRVITAMYSLYPIINQSAQTHSNTLFSSIFTKVHNITLNMWCLINN